MNKINLINGYYGHSNFGDDLFVTILEEKLITKKCMDYHFSKLHSNNLKKISNQMYNTINARTITLGGGSILGVDNKFGIRALEVFLKKYIGFKYAGIGVGIHDHQNFSKNLIKNMDFLSVRSVRDFNIIKKEYPSVRYGSDLAYSYKSLFSLPKIADCERIPNNIGLVITNIGYYGMNLIEESNFIKFVSYLNELDIENISVNIYNFQPARVEDKIIFSSLFYLFDKYNVMYKYIEHQDVHITIKSIRENIFMFTDRLHGAIISHCLAIPFSLSEHHNKCHDFLRDVNYKNSLFDFSFNPLVSFKGNTQVSIDKIREHEEYAISSLNEWYSSVLID